MKRITMILMVAALLAAMVFSTGCAKKKFDIRGLWNVDFNWTTTASVSNLNSTLGKAGSLSAGSTTITFSGEIESGTFINGYGETGTYTVSDKNVTYIFPSAIYTGTSTDDNTMSGTMTNGSGGSGTWSASR